MPVKQWYRLEKGSNISAELLTQREAELAEKEYDSVTLLKYGLLGRVNESLRNN